MIKPFLLALGLSFSAVHAASNVTTCRLGADHAAQVKIKRSSKIYDTHVYAVQLGEQEKTPIFGDNDNSRGARVQIKCFGETRRALILSGEFTANALQGILFTYNQATKRIQRLDFAEKNYPSWAYLGARSNMLIFQTNGIGESNKKYVVYLQTEDSEPKIEFIDSLPQSNGFEIQSIK